MMSFPFLHSILFSLFLKFEIPHFHYHHKIYHIYLLINETECIRIIEKIEYTTEWPTISLTRQILRVKIGSSIVFGLQPGMLVLQSNI